MNRSTTGRTLSEHLGQHAQSRLVAKQTCVAEGGLISLCDADSHRSVGKAERRGASGQHIHADRQGNREIAQARIEMDKMSWWSTALPAQTLTTCSRTRHRGTLALPPYRHRTSEANSEARRQPRRERSHPA